MSDDKLKKGDEVVQGVSGLKMSLSTLLLKHFGYDHLPEHLQEVSKPICELAKKMDEELPHSIEKAVGMRKLLEAKDCFVRAKLD